MKDIRFKVVGMVIGASLSEPHIDHDNVPRHGECLYISMYLSGCVLSCLVRSPLRYAL